MTSYMSIAFRIVVLVLAAGFVLRAALEPESQSRLKLVSPDGKHQVVIYATNDGAGILLGRTDAGGVGPFVAMYEGFDLVDGAAMGVCGPGQATVMEAALSASGAGGGVQIVRRVVGPPGKQVYLLQPVDP